jgi:hypothetical protein
VVSWALFARRMRAHPAAVAAVAATVVLSTLVIGTLQVFSTAVADGAVATALERASLPERTITVTGPVGAGLPAMDAAVDDAAEDLDGSTRVSRWAESASFGISGRPDTVHVQLAEVRDVEHEVEVVEGTWPASTGSSGPIEAAVSEVTARELGWSVGTTVRLRDLIEDAPASRVRVTALWSPSDPDTATWADDPFAGAGVIRTDFTTYGPLLVPEGTFSGPMGDRAGAVWRIVPALDGLDTGALDSTRADVQRTVADLEDSAELTGTRTTTALPGTLGEASDASSASATALLTPSVLLLLLALAAIGLAGGLVATLREQETRLVRARGASSRQVALLALAEGLVVVVPSIALALLLSPLLADLLPGADVESPLASSSTVPFLAVGLTAALALSALVLTAARAGRLRTSSGKAGRRGPIRTFLQSVGVDVTLLVLGAVGVLQLRRYHESTTSDPVVVLAPTLVIAALCVVCLRALPVIARLAGRRAARTRGLPLAWGAWQVARRLRDQAGAVLLILLAVAMGSLALTQQATAASAVEDQAAYAAGAPLRVDPAIPLRADPRLADAYRSLGVQAAGGEPTVMGVRRDTIDVGSLDGVTLLAVDAGAADEVMVARPDQLGGSTWSQLTRSITPAVLPVDGITLPGEPTRIAVTGRVAEQPTDIVMRARITVVLQDADGHWFRAPVGNLTSKGLRTVEGPVVPAHADAATDDRVLRSAGVRYPLSVVGFTADYDDPTRFFFFTGPDNRTNRSTTLTGLAVSAPSGGEPTPVAGAASLAWSADPDDAATVVVPANEDRVPVIVTGAVAAAADVTRGDEFSLGHLGREIPVVVTGVVDALPAIDDPEAGVLVDLGALQGAESLASQGATAALSPLEPTEWWLAPRSGDTVDLHDALADHPDLATEVVDRDELATQRSGQSVNAGLRGAMQLVSVAALALAAIGFAATTVTLGRLRRSESAVLAALGLSPRSLRNVLVTERVGLVALTTLVGLGLGVLAAWLTVPLLVTANGQGAVPPVLVQLPWLWLGALGAGLVVALALVALLAVRPLPRAEVTGTLRMGAYQ